MPILKYPLTVIYDKIYNYYTFISNKEYSITPEMYSLWNYIELSYSTLEPPNVIANNSYSRTKNNLEF